MAQLPLDVLVPWSPGESGGREPDRRDGGDLWPAVSPCPESGRDGDLKALLHLLMRGRHLVGCLRHHWSLPQYIVYKPAERPKYIEAFFSNINWAACDERLAKRGASRPAVIA